MNSHDSINDSRERQRPHSRLYAPVRPVKHPKYTWVVRSGFFDTIKVSFFKTKDEADAFAARHNAPALLLKSFRPFFDTEAETRAFLRLPKLPANEPTETEAAAPEALAKALTIQDRYMGHNQFRVKPYRKKSRPDLRFVVRFKEAGKYAGRYFETKREAESFATARNIEVANHGLEALDMPGEIRGMAMRCHNALSEFGKTIADATAHYIAVLKAAQKSISLDGLLAAHVEHMKKHGQTWKHITDISTAARDFAHFAGNQTIASNVTLGITNDYIASLSRAFIYLTPVVSRYFPPHEQRNRHP